MIKKLSLILIAAIFFSTIASAQTPSLKEVFKKDFLIGTAMNTWQIEGKDTAADRINQTTIQCGYTRKLYEGRSN